MVWLSGGLSSNSAQITTLTSATILADTPYSSGITTGSFPYDMIFCDATSAGFTVTLPLAAYFPNLRLRFKKIDATNNAILIARAGSDTIDGLTSRVLIAPFQYLEVVSNGVNWFVPENILSPVRLCRTTVDLVAAGSPALLTVPTGRTLRVTDTILEGVTAQTGAGGTSVLKLGTAAGTYELLPTVTFTVGTANSLLVAGARKSVNALATTMATGAAAYSFAAGAALVANVTPGGTPLTTGSVAVELYGYFA